jgi:zinc transporter ZupT
MVGWVTAGIAFLIAAFASSGELLIRASEFRGQRRSSRRYLRLCLGYVLGNGLAAAIIAAILHIVVVPTGSSIKLHPDSPSSWVPAIVGAFAALGLLRATRTRKLEPTLGQASGQVLEGMDSTVQAAKFILAYLLSQIDDVVRHVHFEYIQSETDKLISNQPPGVGSYGLCAAQLMTLVMELSDLFVSGKDREKMVGIFRDDLTRLGDNGLSDEAKWMLAVRCCVHHAGSEVTQQALINVDPTLGSAPGVPTAVGP